MRYLREAAKEFAQAHPDRAAMLDLDKAGTPDPFVERLFEGFAFSMGQLRQKIDDDLPELTEGLVSLLWPHYLQTIPSLSIIELTPDIQKMKMTDKISAQFEVLSRPIGPKKTICHYRTTQDLTLNPIRIETVNLTTEPDGRSVIQLKFTCSEIINWSEVNLHKLSFYLSGDIPTTNALHLALTKQVSKIYLKLPQSKDRIVIITVKNAGMAISKFDHSISANDADINIPTIINAGAVAAAGTKPITGAIKILSKNNPAVTTSSCMIFLYKISSIVIYL